MRNVGRQGVYSYVISCTSWWGGTTCLRNLSHYVARENWLQASCKEQGYVVSEEVGKSKLPVLKTTSLVSEAQKPWDGPLPSSSGGGAILAWHKCGFRQTSENMAWGLLFHILCRKQGPALPAVLGAQRQPPGVIATSTVFPESLKQPTQALGTNSYKSVAGLPPV